MTDLLFIINPASARGRTVRMWAAAREELTRLGITVTEQITTSPGDATRIARAALEEGFTRVIAVGGDGTLGEVINGYLDEQGRPINPAASVALLPSGTGSDFRRSLGLTGLSDWLRAVTSQSAKLIDAVRIVFTAQDGSPRHRLFINLASFGLGGQAVGLVNKWRESLPRWINGRARFSAAAIRALGSYRLRRVEVQIDGQRKLEISTNLIVVANGRFAGGGMMFAPNAELDDGLLDVILTDRASRFDVIRELPRIHRGGLLKNPRVSELRAREVSVTSDDPLAIDLDGELAGYTPARLNVLPSAVRFAL